MTFPHSHDVLVVGAGPGGLATAIGAARHGASVLVVERHPGTAIHPRALGISTRTMEVFRTWGITDAVRACSVSTSVESGRGRTLADPDMRSGPLGYPSPREALAVSPTLPAACPQDLLEPLLVEQARAHGAEVRFGAELTSVEVTGHGARATVRERATGALYAVRARYLVGADGPRSSVRTALGIGVEHLGTMGHFAQAVTLAAEVATMFRAGRGFLVGDAAHRMTPVGARGLNTAIHDGHNLGWKVAWVARGIAGEGLLDSYAEEREPVGRRNATRSLRTGGPDPSDGLPGDLGVRYRSGVLATGATGRARPGYVDPSAGTATVGERAPHLWTVDGRRRRSTLDLFDGRLTLLTGPRGRDWHRAARRLVGTGVPIAALSAGVEIADPGRRLTRAYRTADGGAVLVRPDGVVAWRSRSAADADTALTGAVATALGHHELVDVRAG